MPFTDGHGHHNGVEHEVNGGIDELHLNPFDDGTDNKPFTSGRASSHSHAQHTVTRRRGDSEGASSYNPNCMPSSVHSRSRTFSDHASGSRDHHPLSSRPSTSSVRHDAGPSTRPRLARAVSSWASETRQAADESNENGNGVAVLPTSRPDEQQRLVLVHQVLPKDSLAGVALKYGIPLAELRRANQLWPSDPIHLRNVLYIPIDQARHAKLAFLDAAASEQADLLHPEEDLSSSSVVADPSSASASSSSSPRPPPSSGLYTLRRVPNSRLSFFPPSHSSHTTMRSSRDGSPSTPPSILTADYFSPPPVLESTRNRLLSATSTLAPRLAPLFSALPFSASTRDEIISRLSFDSSSNTTSVSDEQEVELSPVGHTQSSRQAFSGATSPTPSSHTIISTSPNHRLRPKATGDASRRRSKKERARAEEEEELIPLGSPTMVRTVQMEPSPAMQLPPRIARSVSASEADMNMKREGEPNGHGENGGPQLRMR